MSHAFRTQCSGAVALMALLAPALHAQSTVRVGVRADGSQPTYGSSGGSLSSDGRYVVLEGDDELTPGDVNLQPDVLLRDRWTGINRVVSVSTAGVQGDARSYSPRITGNARWVVFGSQASTLTPQPNVGQGMIFVRDLQLGTTTAASFDVTGASGPDSYCTWASISDDGRYVVFETDATNLVPGDTNACTDVFLRDMQLGITERLSVSAGGVQGNFWSGYAAISGDGLYISFTSAANTLVPGDTNGTSDIFVLDRVAGTTSRVMAPGGFQVNDYCEESSLSSNGRFLAFTSDATNIVPGNTGTFRDVFRLDRLTGSFLRLNVDALGVEADDHCYELTISDSGRFVGWISPATNLVPGDTNGADDIFVRDCVAGSTVRASVSSSAAEGSGGIYAYGTFLSGDGRFVGFETELDNLVPGDTNGSYDVFVRDLQSASAPVVAYCVAKLNSLGCLPAVSSTGEPHVAGSDDGFFLSASQVRNRKPGLLVWSNTSASTPFGGGTLCIGGTIVRATLASSGGSSSGQDCSGTYAFHFGHAYIAAHAIVSGQTIYGQFWSRDNGFAAPNNLGLSDGIRFTTFP